jgi:hypothetical protein
MTNQPQNRKMKIKSLLLNLFFSATLLFAKACTAQTNNPLNQHISEDDWSLPAYVSKSDNAGLYWEYVFKDADNLLVTWKQLNPSENVYNWSILDQATSLNIPFFLRIWASDTTHIPQWVKTKYPTMPVLHWGAPGETYPDLLGNNSPSNFYALWHPGFTQEFKKFLMAFKAKNYLSNPNLKFMYVPSAWRWNEWELGPMLQQIKTNAPISPTSFVSWFKEHLDDYADASNGYPHKMVFTGFGRIENPLYYGGDANWFLALNDTTNGNNILTNYAVSLGMSVREGAQEYFNSSNDSFAWGAPSKTINNINYQFIDETNPLHNNPLRIIGTENEGFCDPAMLDICSYYHIKMSTLKALQLRVNWLNTRDAYIKSYKPIFEYARLTMNKTVKNSPDAWVSLRQTYDPYFSANPPLPIYNSPAWVHRVTLPYRNWEKWLYQRDVPIDGIVTPVYQLNSNHQFDIWNLKAFEALRTNQAKGSNYMYFDVDDAFIKGGTNSVQIKITYLDNFAGNWWVEYDAANNESATKKSTEVINSNTNTWKTITINIIDAGFTNRQNGGMDFRIYNGGKNDMSVRFVRLIKTNPPNSASNSVEDCLNEIRIFPNPSTSVLRVKTDTQLKEITIFDASGKLVLKKNIGYSTLDISTLANGVYFIMFETIEGIKCSKKFVKN